MVVTKGSDNIIASRSYSVYAFLALNPSLQYKLPA